MTISLIKGSNSRFLSAGLTAQPYLRVKPAHLFPLNLLIIALIIFFQSSASGQTNTKKFNSFADSYFKLYKPPSVALGIKWKDSLRWTTYRGYADLENGIPATPRTLYRIASISKLITAIAIMQLVENGKINLDDDVRKYLPEFPRKKYIFTIRQVLNHTSGIRTYRNKEFDLTIYFNSTKDAVAYIAHDSLEFKPGTKYLYSTLAFNLLAAVIEKVANTTFEDYLTQKIFIPAKMSSTRFDVHKSLIPNRAKGYVRNAPRDFENAPLADLSIKYAGGGILSTVEDLLNLGSALIENKLIKSSTLDTMLVPSRMNPSYGLGVTLNFDKKETPHFGHSGAGTGFVSNLLIYPKQKIVAVHLINLRDRNINDPAKELVKVALSDTLSGLPQYLMDDTLHYITKSSGIREAIIFLDSAKTRDSISFRKTLPSILDFSRDLTALNKRESSLKILLYLHNLYPNDPAILTELGKTYILDGNMGLGLKYLKISFQITKDPNLKQYILQQEKINKKRN